MTAAIGFLMIIAIVALLLKGKMSPIVVLAVIPVIAALILGFSPVEVMDFIADGIKTTTSNGILFIFSVIYFGVLADTGLFDVIVGWLVKKAGNNVIAVTVVTSRSPALRRNQCPPQCRGRRALRSHGLAQSHAAAGKLRPHLGRGHHV